MEYKVHYKDDDVVKCDSCGCDAPTHTAPVDKIPDYQVVKCDSCGCDAPTALFESTVVAPRMLCEFCSTTMASRYNERPYLDDFTALRAEIWKAAACVFNKMRR